MSRRDDRDSLFQMREHAGEAVEMAAARTRQDLDNDRQFALALARLMEIVGALRIVSASLPRSRSPKFHGLM